MKKKSTRILLIVDRSGSMSVIHDELINGINVYIEEQKSLKDVGECKIDIVQFDNKIENVILNTNIEYAPTFTNKDFKPRGWTALWDAIGQSVDRLGLELSNTHHDERPEKVIVIIQTDGEENYSKEYTQYQIKDKIKHQKEKYNWDFVFVGANQDAILTADTIGISRDSSMSFSASTRGMSNTLCSLNSYTSSYRTSGSACFSDVDRASAMEV